MSREPTPSPVAAARGLPDRAVFVVGMPRSGTTLMRVILNSHPDVAMFPGEFPLWRDVAPAHAHRDLSRADERWPLIVALLEHPRVASAGVMLDDQALAASLEAEPTVTAGTVFAHALRQYARQAGKPRWGVKDPRTEFHVDAILTALPAAGIVHMVRDPRDVLASQRARWGRPAQHIVSTVEDWRRSVTLARLSAHDPTDPARRGVGPNAYVPVRYEDLVADPTRIVRDICHALDLEFDPAMLDVAGTSLWPPSTMTVGEAATAAEAITDRSVGRHRRDLSAGEMRYIEWKARREMAEWDYRTEARRGGRARMARCVLEEIAWRAAQRLRVWPMLARALGRLPSDRDARPVLERGSGYTRSARQR